MDKIREESINRFIRLSGFLFIILTLVVTPASAEKKKVSNSLGMNFVLISAGSFWMGSPSGEAHRHRTENRHKVIISRPYYLQTTEVTLKQWWAIMGKKFIGRRSGTNEMPVTNVSWHESQKFIRKLNKLNKGVYRLPTEAEWEYAARAGSTEAYSWGRDISCSQAMFGNKSDEVDTCVDYLEKRGIPPNQPAPVMSYSPNDWGLYDMHGNVWEWCLDDYVENLGDRTVTDPLMDKDIVQKVRKGGSWFKYGYSTRSANRAFAHAASRFKTTGFRLVLSYQP